MTSPLIGVTITEGPQDWQIFQRNPQGSAKVKVSGTWRSEDTPCFVQVRVVDENTNMPVTARLDWADAAMDPDACTITGIFHGHSPWLAFGKKIRKQTGLPVGLIPCALGGSPIVRWLPDEIGDLFDNMADMVRKVGDRTAGILWIQGETETFLREANLYRDRFVRCLRALRNHFADERLPVFVGQLNAHSDQDVDDREWTLIREVQRSVCADDPHAHLVVTVDNPLSDGIHNNAAANVTIGERFADRALEHIYGYPIQSGFPEPERVVFQDAERTRIRVEFVHVSGDWTQSWGCRDFRVEDESGWIEVRPEITCSEIILHLERSAASNTVVHGLFGAMPRVTLFDDDGRCITPFSMRL